MKTYTTGEVAEICGFKNARIVAKMFDKDEIGGELVTSKYQRRTTRRISLRDLLEFMNRKNIPLDRLSEDIEAQKWILCQMTLEFKKSLDKARRRSGVFTGFRGLVNGMLEVVHNLDPLTNLSGASEDRRRVLIFKKLIEVMESHISLRAKIATSKKR